MSFYYPPYIKTVLKTGAIIHLITTALGLYLVANRLTALRRYGKPRRRGYKLGKWGMLLSVRDERHRELIRPLLDYQPGLPRQSIFKPFVAKDLD